MSVWSSASFRSSSGGDENLSEFKQPQITLSDGKFVVLEQNVPNPFAERTTIRFTVPNDATNAKIVFHDGLGKQVQSVQVKIGSGTLDVFASDLSTGTYSYTLIVDGKVVGSKKMAKTN